MNVWKISLQNIKSKPLYTFISIISLALSVTLLLGIQQLKSSFKYQIDNNLGNIDLVIGAKGSPLQLVLASVLHIDNPTGNISYKEAKKISRNPMVKLAVPISYGDNYKGFKIVGTSNDFITLYNAKLKTGRKTKENLEVVIGSTIAEKLNLVVGDTFLSSHGLIENEIEVHDEKFTVVGILQPTQQVIDRLILTKLESIWNVHEHEENSHDHKHHESDEDKEITSLLVSFKNPIALLSLPRRINEKTNMQAALPKYELDKLYNYTGIGFVTINWIAYLILCISGVTIFVNLHKMVKERTFDLALLRTFGASNLQLIKMVAYEGLIIAFISIILGILFVKLTLNFIVNYLQLESNQNILRTLPFNELLSIVVLIFSIVIISICLSIYPIIKMNISRILSHEK